MKAQDAAATKWSGGRNEAGGPISQCGEDMIC
jgi:hypothetical protein